MDLKTKIAISVLVSFNVVIVLLPLMEFLLCQEPEIGWAENILVKAGIVKTRTFCPMVTATLLDVLKNSVTLVIEGILGYLFRKLTADRVRPRRDFFEELDGPLPEGFIPGVTVRHLF